MQNNNQLQVIKLDDPFLSKFPMDSVEGFKHVENCIVNENRFSSKLVIFRIH